jgi:predicted Fe-S protein YdhL (DUF1289 family)
MGTVARPVDPLQSPCIGVCTIAPATSLCRGCWRSIDEIGGWRAMSASQRAAVLVLTAQRRQPSRAG